MLSTYFPEIIHINFNSALLDRHDIRTLFVSQFVLQQIEEIHSF